MWTRGFGRGRTTAAGGRRRRDADEIGISMRVIVGSPGAGQYRVFSSVREHSKHRATMAQNGRQLPDTPLSREPLSPSFSFSLFSSRVGARRDEEKRVRCWTSEVFDGKIFSNICIYIFNDVLLRVQLSKFFEQSYRRRVFIYLSYFDR